MSYVSIKGMNDLLPPYSFLWKDLEIKARSFFESFGFSEIVTPLVEKTELFTRSIGEASDIVEKQMYTFKDKSLRPEGTAPVVRAYIEHQLYHPDSYQKFYYWGPMYRCERMQKGRYREFHQFGIEVFGSASPKIDAETIYMLSKFYESIGVRDFNIELNSMGCHLCRPKYRQILLSSLQSHVSRLCEDCQRRLEKNPLRIFDCKKEECREISQKLPKIIDHLCEECLKHFKDVQGGLQELHMAFHLNPRIVRGLDYYVKTAFEIVSSKLGAQDSLGGGGRYDGLVKELGGPDIPAFGFAGGIERLVLVLDPKIQEESFKKEALDIFIAALGSEAQHLGYGWVNRFRLKGIRSEIDYDDRPLKTQMKRADRMKAKYVLIIGDTEIEKKEAILRNMDTKEQKSVSFHDMESVILKELKK